MSKLAQKQKKVDFSGQVCWVGVDVHKISYSVALLSEVGLRTEFSLPASPQKLLLKLASMGITIKGLVYESGPTGFPLAWECQRAGVPVVVAAPSRIPRPLAATGKTDRLDSMRLAELLAKDMLKSIAIPTEAENQLRSLERRRQQIVESKRTARQHIKSFILLHGLEEPDGLSHWSLAALEALRTMPLPKNLRASLDSYLREHAFLVEELSSLRKQLAAALQTQDKEQTVTYLRSIPGVGETIAGTFLAEIFRPERFARAEELCAYVGLAPITSHSGSGKATARLGQVGQKYLRSILVEGAWRLIAVEEQYRALFTRVRLKTGLVQKGLVAVARKLLILLWRVAVEKRPYRPAPSSPNE